MKTQTDQGRLNLFRLHCVALFWRAVESLEPVGSSEMEGIQKSRARAVGALRRAQILREERRMNQGRDK